MKVPLEISFRKVDRTTALVSLIEEKVAKLEQVCDYIISCHVVIDRKQQHQQSGNPFEIRIDMHVPPGHMLTLRRKSGEGDMHASLEQVLRDAFGAARRKLKALVEKQRGRVKVHAEGPRSGEIVRIFPDKEYGFFRTATGEEVYFDRLSLRQDDFDGLSVGMPVTYGEILENARAAPGSVQPVNNAASMKV